MWSCSGAWGSPGKWGHCNFLEAAASSPNVAVKEVHLRVLPEQDFPAAHLAALSQKSLALPQRGRSWADSWTALSSLKRSSFSCVFSPLIRDETIHSLSESCTLSRRLGCGLRLLLCLHSLFSRFLHFLTASLGVRLRSRQARRVHAGVFSLSTSGRSSSRTCLHFLL